MKADETKRKREILLGINPCIYGLNYHDPAVVVLIDGRVVLAAGATLLGSNSHLSHGGNQLADADDDQDDDVIDV